MFERDLRPAAFPELDEAQMTARGRCPLTALEQYRDREKLFEAGDRDLSRANSLNSAACHVPAPGRLGVGSGRC
jgi:hypothetical protein